MGLFYCYMPGKIMDTTGSLTRRQQQYKEIINPVTTTHLQKN
jgi:hypothetical protein